MRKLSVGKIETASQRLALRMVKVAALAWLAMTSLASAGLYDSYAYHATIQFSGYSKAETLTNFPALVVLNTANISGFDYGQFLSGSNDLRFTTADGNTDLSYEIEKWDTSGSSYVWVRVPTIAGASDSIMAYWGSSGASASPSTTNGATWDANYRGVWHLQTPNATDSTSNRFTGTASGNTNVTGKIGTGQGFDGTNNRNIALPTAISTGISGGITVMAWANLHGALGSGTYQAIVSEMYSGDGNVVYELFADGGKLSAGFYDGSWHQIIDGAALPLDQWCHTASTYDGHFVRLYRNGVQVAISLDLSRVLPTGTNPWEIGHRHDGTDTWNGLIDEARISKNACSSNWIWASYMNMASNATAFQAYGMATASSGAPSAQNLAPTNVVSGAAFLNAKVAATGGAPVTVAAVYWGPTDGGTNAALWANTNALTGGPWNKDDVLTINITTLTPGQDCFYTYYVSNAVGGALAKPSAYFTEGEVTLTATDASCGVLPTDTATVLVSRPANCTNGDVKIYYTTAGDATNTVNYTVDKASGFTLAAGQSNATITITPQSPWNTGAPKTFTLSLVASNYVVGAANTATCTLQTVTQLYGAWACSAPIAFAGYNRTEALTNFPALVVLSNNCFDGFSYGLFQSGSNDLRFTTADGFYDLNYEIESWNPGGASYVWVQVPVLASNTVIKAWWGASGQTALPCTTNGAVWSSEYRGVWHLGQTNAVDSTANRNSGTASSNTAAVGTVGPAQNFIPSQSINCGNAASVQVSGDMTCSAWVKRNATGEMGILGKWSGSYIWDTYNDKNSIYFNGWQSGNTTIPVGQWAYLSFTFKNATKALTFFYNGLPDGSSTYNQIQGSGQNLYIGQRGDGYYMNGLIDEARLEATPRSTNWVWACYMNQAQNRTFASYGTIAVSSGAPLVNNDLPTGITATSANLNGYLSSTGSSPTTVWVCWGRQNGLAGGAWEFTNQWAEGYWAQGSHPTTNVNLVADRYYYYAYYASNAGGTSPGGAQGFSTAGITIQGTKNGSEVGPANGLFTVTRPDTATNGDLWVNFTVDGTVANSATIWDDYSLNPSGSVLIPAGAASATIAVQVRQDGLTEPTETVKLDLAPGLYVVGSPGSATIGITNGPSANNNTVWWRTRDGSASGIYTNAWWGDLQQAITNAQGGAAGLGEVRIAGNVQRSSYDTTISLSASGAGNVKISGGWDATCTVQSNSVRSVLDANSATLTTKGGVMQVSAPNVTLGNLWLKNGRNRAGAGLNADANATGLTVVNCVISDNDTTGTAPNGTSPGAGAYIHDCNRVKVSRTIIANNRGGGNNSGSGMYVGNVGTETDPIILEYCHVSNNAGDDASHGFGPSIFVAGTSHAMIALSRITGGWTQPGSALYSTVSDKVTVFGSLFDGNSYGPGYGDNQALIMQANNASKTDALVLANCTLANNTMGYGMRYGLNANAYRPAAVVAHNGNSPLLLMNTIVGVTDSNSTTMGHGLTLEEDNGNYKPHVRLQNCAFSATARVDLTNTFYYIDSEVPCVGLTNAFAQTVPASIYRFHALDTSGAVVANPGMASNYEGRISFVTNDNLTAANPLLRAYKFALQAADPALASGVLRSGPGFKYVDIDHDGVFSNTVDVVVAGTPPAGALYVYEYDLKYLGRVTLAGSTLTIESNTVLSAGVDPSGLPFSKPTPWVRSTIDRGAYQTIVFPAGGSVVFFR